MKIVEIRFEDIFHIWKHFLWRERSSPIEPISSMKYLGGYDLSIKNNIPKFFGISESNSLIGVNSGFITLEGLYRSRGLWVRPEYRGIGLGRELLRRTSEEAEKVNCRGIWSFPRKRALPVYESIGFIKKSDWITENVEFGPNCYVLKEF